MTDQTRQTLAPWIATILFFGVWEVVCQLFGIDTFILPAPSDALGAMWDNWGPLWHHSGITLYTTAIGFALAVVFGLGLGIAVGASPTLYHAIYPLLIGFNSIPKVAIVPILVVWFGIGPTPSILTAFSISFFPIVVNVATGLATIEPELKDVLRSLGASKLDIIRKVGIPRSLPYFFASLKIAITLAFVGAVIAETIAGSSGIGHLMLVASSSFRVPLVFAGLFVISIMGIGMYVIFSIIERRMTGWATRSETNFATGG